MSLEMGRQLERTDGSNWFFKTGWTTAHVREAGTTPDLTERFTKVKRWSQLCLKHLYKDMQEYCQSCSFQDEAD